MGLIQGLHGVNVALFPPASDVTMIYSLEHHPYASVALEIAGAVATGLVFYLIGATRFGWLWYDDVGGKRSSTSLIRK